MGERLLLSVLMLGQIALSSSRAEVLFSDNFAYPDGPLVAVAEGKWKTHSGTPEQVTVTSGEVLLSQKRSEDVSASLGSGPINATNGVALYAGFSVRFTALPSGSAGGYFAHFKDTTPTMGLRCRVFVTTNGVAAGSIRLGVAAATNAASALLPQALKLNTPYKLVCRLMLSNNVATLWLNPKSERDPGVTSTDDAAVKSVSAFAFRQSLASGNGMGDLIVDNLAVATTFAETLLNSPPAILTHPKAQTVPAGADVRFSAEAIGSEPLTYQWLFNGAELAGANEPELNLTGVHQFDSGEYQVYITNSAGSALSDAASLVVQPALSPIQIVCDRVLGIRLSWVAEPEQSYSVWGGATAEMEYSLLSSELVFWDEGGWFEESWPEPTSRFYRVSSP